MSEIHSLKLMVLLLLLLLLLSYQNYYHNHYDNHYCCSNTDKDNNDILGEDWAPLFLVLNGLSFLTT